MSQEGGGSELSRPSVSSERRATNLVSRKRVLRSPAVSCPALRAGLILARHRISSAIQFPIPEKPSWERTTALIGALPCRRRKVSRNSRSNLGETISGTALLHQAG